MTFRFHIQTQINGTDHNWTHKVAGKNQAQFLENKLLQKVELSKKGPVVIFDQWPKLYKYLNEKLEFQTLNGLYYSFPQSATTSWKMIKLHSLSLVVKLPI